ncbi:hypothetical protein Tco_0196084 [Tanacetum coccineum]
MFDVTSDVLNCDDNRVYVESKLVESLINRDTSIDNSSKIDPIFEEFADELAHIAPIPPGIVEDDFDSIMILDQEKEEFDLDDILQIQDVILREKLLNDSRLISNIESLKDNPIPIMDSDSSETSLSFSDNSLPELKSFNDHMEETRSGSTTTHANYSLPEYESFHFDNLSLPRPLPEPPYWILKLEINILMCFIMMNLLNQEEMKMLLFQMLKRTIPSHLSFVPFFHLSLIPRFLLYLASPGVKIRSLTLASSLRAGGTDISEITRKPSKNEQARTRESEEYKKKPKNQSEKPGIVQAQSNLVKMVKTW